jgi:small subunit ribosomal protein S17
MSESVANAVAEKPRGERLRKVGRVVSSSMEKSVVVRVDWKVRHPKYQKFVAKSSKFMAHDENGSCGVGDRVEIIETRPISKRKRWRVVRIVEKAR